MKLVLFGLLDQANVKPIIVIMFILACLFVVVVVVVLLFQIWMNVLQKPTIAVLMPFAIISRVHTTARANLDTMGTERTAAEVNNLFMLHANSKGKSLLKTIKFNSFKKSVLLLF